MFFKLFSSTLYTAHDGHKSRSELISLITEPLGMQHGEQFASVAIVNNDEASSPAANATEEGNLEVCRICYSTSDLQSLITPCQCSGTMGILHRTCLERWLEVSNTTKCEICQHEYEITRHPKSWFYFFTTPIRSSDIRYLINDTILFSALTLIIGWLWIVSLAKIRMAQTMRERASYIPLPTAILSTYVVWCWVSFRYHVQVLREWRSLNQQIRVVSQKEQKVMSVSVDHLERGDHRLDQSRALLPTPDRDVSPVAIHPHEQVPLFNICTLK